jgi:hypothetical protein
MSTCRGCYGYYERAGTDAEGWPQWRLVTNPPPMKLKEQDVLLKHAVILYFREAGVFT